MIKLCSPRTLTRLPSIILRTFSTSPNPNPKTQHQRTQSHDRRFPIELVDTDLWGFNSRCEFNEKFEDFERTKDFDDFGDDGDASPDFDEIDELRLRKRLFYKLDRGSKEFEEYSLDFHRRGSSNKSRDKKIKKEVKKTENEHDRVAMRSQLGKDRRRDEESCHFVENGEVGINMERTVEAKKVRVPTFNQMTEQYHFPFCLDIYVSKGSVRACVVHRVSSKVVAVAHSISKDMKFDLKSRTNDSTCAAVGAVLAQRALEDDIHNIIYTPRKGDKIEGKIQIVLQSIIDHGVDVKVKLKQKQFVKTTQTGQFDAAWPTKQLLRG